MTGRLALALLMATALLAPGCRRGAPEGPALPPPPATRDAPRPFGQAIRGYNEPLSFTNGVGFRAAASDGGYLVISIRNNSAQPMVIGPDQFRLIEADRTTTPLEPGKVDLAGFAVQTLKPGDAVAVSARFAGSPELVGRRIVFNYPPLDVLAVVEVEPTTDVII